MLGTSILGASRRALRAALLAAAAGLGGCGQPGPLYLPAAPAAAASVPAASAA
ncbi:MAG: lipoprotein, partial [Betaproteobacteria bacterium]|nr:lipoprotein [Betaproteobacteria bacterium]